jgi:type IX secretion system PorP/SprF family membrane protein
MKRDSFIVSLLFLFVINLARGQASPDSSKISLGYPVYSQYLQNGLIINPAYAGSRGSMSIFMSYRKQWMGIKDAPEITSFSVHAPMKNDRVALGLLAQFMNYGVTKSKSIYADYAYQIRVGAGKVSFGLKAGTDISNTDYSGILETLTDPGDPVFSSTDKMYVLPNVGAGVYYFSDRLFAGLAVPAFLNYRKTDQGKTQVYHSFNEYDFRISAGGLITFSPEVKFKPSLLLDYSLNKTKKLTQLDINGNLILRDILWIGCSWRTSEQVLVGIMQVQVTPQFMFGFSYDYPIGKMNSYSSGSGEIILRYEFGTKVSAANPRYF